MKEPGTFLRDHANEIAELPPEDPLHGALRMAVESGELDLEPNLDLDRLSAESDELRRTLETVDAPLQLESDLLATLEDGTVRRGPAWWGWGWGVLAVAAALVLLFFAGWYQLGPGTNDMQAEAAPTTAPTVVALKFWHTTCPACEKIDPIYAGVVDDFETDGDVLFVTLDMSTEASRRQSRLLAAALGVEPLYDELFGETGFVVLLDGHDRRELARLTTRHDETAMRGIIEDALATARG